MSYFEMSFVSPLLPVFALCLLLHLFQLSLFYSPVFSVLSVFVHSKPSVCSVWLSDRLFSFNCSCVFFPLCLVIAYSAFQSAVCHLLFLGPVALLSSLEMLVSINVLVNNYDFCCAHPQVKPDVTDR